MQKVQITLTGPEAEILSFKAAQLGYNITRYIKLLLGKEVLSTLTKTEYPVFKISKTAQKTVAQAHKAHKQGKTIELKSVDDLDKLI